MYILSVKKRPHFSYTASKAVQTVIINNSLTFSIPLSELVKGDYMWGVKCHCICH